jgi:hypothetical protein
MPSTPILIETPADTRAARRHSPARRTFAAALLVFAILIAAAASPPHRTPGADMHNLQLNEPMLEGWLEKSFAPSDAQFVPVDRHTDLLFEYLEQSRGSTGLFIAPGADPWRGARPTEWKAHAAAPGGIDLLRTDYAVPGATIRLLEGRNFLLLRATPTGPAASDMAHPKAFIESLLRTVVRSETGDHHWQFQLPDDLAGSARPRLISSMHAPPLKELASRHQRADILLYNGAVYFVFYKRIEQLEGFLPDDAWFSAPARAALAANHHTP